MAQSNETNRHHIIFPKRHYKTPEEKKFRGHQLLVVRTCIVAHDELHALLQPPRKLNRPQMLGAISLLNELQRDKVPQLDAIIHLADYFSERTDRERLVGQHLVAQMSFLHL